MSTTVIWSMSAQMRRHYGPVSGLRIALHDVAYARLAYQAMRRAGVVAPLARGHVVHLLATPATFTHTQKEVQS